MPHRTILSYHGFRPRTQPSAHCGTASLHSANIRVPPACLPAGLTQRLPSTVAYFCSLSVLTLCLAGALAGASPERAQLWPWQVSLSSGCSTPPASQSWPRVKHLPIRSAGSPDPTLTYFPGVKREDNGPSCQLTQMEELTRACVHFKPRAVSLK